MSQAELVIIGILLIMVIIEFYESFIKDVRAK